MSQVTQVTRHALVTQHTQLVTTSSNRVFCNPSGIMMLIRCLGTCADPLHCATFSHDLVALSRATKRGGIGARSLCQFSWTDVLGMSHLHNFHRTLYFFYFGYDIHDIRHICSVCLFMLRLWTKWWWFLGLCTCIQKKGLDQLPPIGIPMYSPMTKAGAIQGRCWKPMTKWRKWPGWREVLCLASRWCPGWVADAATPIGTSP